MLLFHEDICLIEHNIMYFRELNSWYIDFYIENSRWWDDEQCIVKIHLFIFLLFDCKLSKDFDIFEKFVDA